MSTTGTPQLFTDREVGGARAPQELEFRDRRLDR